METTSTTIPFLESYPYEVLNIKEYHYTNIVQELQDHFKHASKVFSTIPDDKLHFRYQPDKWSVAEVLGHLIDHHLLFMHRAVTFARGFENPILPSDENLWVKNSVLGNKSFQTLVDLYEKSSTLFETHIVLLEKSQLQHSGIANSIEMTIEQLLSYFIQHEKHHFDFILSHYL
ncbi:MAG: DinB family protein [Fibrobacterales bacterium]